MTALEVLEITARTLRILGDIGTRGAASAADALSELAGDQVYLAMPSVGMMPICDLPKLYPACELERIYAAIYVPFDGDAEGSLAMLIPEEEAVELLVAMGLPSGSSGFDEMQQSALREIGNIVGSAYLNALADMAGMQILPAPPGLACETLGAVMGAIAAQAMQLDQYGLIVQVHMTLARNRVSPEMMLLPRPSGLAIIIERLGVGIDA